MNVEESLIRLGLCTTSVLASRMAARLPRQGHVYIATDKLFVSATTNSIKCLVNWILLRIRVCFINTQHHREARSGQLSGGGMNVPFLSPPESKTNPMHCVARP